MIAIRIGAAAMLMVMTTGCAVSGLSFRQDTRVRITAPEHSERVQLPVTVTWEVEDFTGDFAVYVNRSPQPPGEPLAWFARDDAGCRASDGCPDEEYLALRGIHTTEDTSFTISVMPPSGSPNRREFHDVTIALLDDEGRRIGESAFHVTFELDRDAMQAGR